MAQKPTYEELDRRVKALEKDIVRCKESRPRGPGFDLSPEEICVACYFSVFWNNGVMG